MIYNPNKTITVNKLKYSYIKDIMRTNSAVVLYLLNGVKLTGKIISFDEEVIKFTFFDKDNDKKSDQIILWDAISTIQRTTPSHNKENDIYEEESYSGNI